MKQQSMRRLRELRAILKIIIPVFLLGYNIFNTNPDIMGNFIILSGFFLYYMVWVIGEGIAQKLNNK